jgi:hypothetical protein
MKDGAMETISLNLCIYFGDQVLIVTHQGEGKCEQDMIPVQTLSQTLDRTWRIYKTPTSYQISGNDIEPVDLKFEYLHCGEIAKTTNFGWLKSQTDLPGLAAAFYFIDKSKLINRAVLSYILDRQIKILRDYLNLKVQDEIIRSSRICRYHAG